MKKISVFNLLPAYAALCLLPVSCAPIIYQPYLVPEDRQKENVFYIPHALHAPLLYKKGDFRGGVSTTFVQKNNLFEFQGAYMATNHIGIMANYIHPIETGGVANLKCFELGAGYILPLANNWHFETYGGWGSSKIANRHQTGSSNIKSNHFFLQPAIAVQNKKKTTQLAFISKFTRTQLTVIDTAFDTSREPYLKSQLLTLKANPNHIFWQPGLVFRFGWKYFQFHSGIAISTDLSNSELNQAHANFTLGMTFLLSPETKKK